MRIETLQNFIEIAKCGSFYRASQRLFISQQGLNKSIRALEHELDARLFERTHSGVKLTDEGAVLMARAKQLLDTYELMMAELFEAKHRRTSGETPIPLSISYYAAQSAASNPDYVHLLVNSEYVELPYEMLVEQALDTDYEGLVFLDIHGKSIEEIRNNEMLEFDPVIAMRYGVAVRDSADIAQRKSISCADIVDEPFAVNTNCEMRHVLDYLFDHDPPKDVRLGTTNPRMLIERVQAPSKVLAGFDSFGFFLAQSDTTLNTDGMRFIPLDDDKALAFVGFLKHKDAVLSQRAQSVKRVLRQWLEAHVSAYLTQYPAQKLWDEASTTPTMV